MPALKSELLKVRVASAIRDWAVEGSGCGRKLALLSFPFCEGPDGERIMGRESRAWSVRGVT